MSINYQWKENVYEDVPQGELQVCQFCESEVPVFGFRAGVASSFEGKTKWLCDLCASTPAGTALDYPRQWDSQHRDIMQCVNYSSNMVLFHLGKFGFKPTFPNRNAVRKD